MSNRGSMMYLLSFLSLTALLVWFSGSRDGSRSGWRH